MSEAPAQRPNHLAAVPETPAGRDELLVELLGKFLHHKDQAEKHLAAAKAAEFAIRQLHGQQGKTIEVGDHKVLWKNPNASFMKTEFEIAYPRELNPQFYPTPEAKEPALDVSMIPPALKKRFMKPGSGDGNLQIS